MTNDQRPESHRESDRPLSLDALPAWRAKAACLDEDPELFFPVGTTGAASEQIQQAKAVCRRCDVTAQCLAWALNTQQDAGVWGGKTEEERRALRRTQQRQRYPQKR
jgi:WhiB family transcriptional regulator, redox-sensing transcriptional regulator